MRVVALVDGEHYPPVTRWGIASSLAPLRPLKGWGPPTEVPGVKAAGLTAPIAGLTTSRFLMGITTWFFGVGGVFRVSGIT